MKEILFNDFLYLTEGALTVSPISPLMLRRQLKFFGLKQFELHPTLQNTSYSNIDLIITVIKTDLRRYYSKKKKKTSKIMAETNWWVFYRVLWLGSWWFHKAWAACLFSKIHLPWRQLMLATALLELSKYRQKDWNRSCNLWAQGPQTFHILLPPPNPLNTGKGSQNLCGLLPTWFSGQCWDGRRG